MKEQDILQTEECINFIEEMKKRYRFSEEKLSGLQFMITNHGKKFQHVHYYPGNKKLGCRITLAFNMWVTLMEPTKKKLSFFG